ncbi:endonuclease G [Algoriphagus locisalis]|uniref:Endonuclease G n=1 Tax=Algoriphagus locisalis TaxID=305507 RepID=A0A1I7CAG6_9BACT|nr:DNA/RNA non-specific endonuclease [Algoriphagus locisalis]SFT96441.1 endonuclease G [Algoriphagus locisalis]
MDNINLFEGYNSAFLSTEAAQNIVHLPIVGNDDQEDILKNTNTQTGIFHYLNYSVQISTSRKLAFFSACNIDGSLFKKVPRRDSWKKDSRVGEFQLGRELYSAPKGYFDRGHLTKREDVQWGESSAIAYNAANSTFYFPNAVPQHKDLNRDVWRSLEDYILHKETAKKGLKINVFTGPVLMKSDPFFVTQVKNVDIQIPLYFWKVVVFLKDDGKLYRAGFLMCQKKLLVEDGTVEELEHFTEEDRLFQAFSKAATYQVNISLIEEITGISIPHAADSYVDNRPRELVLQVVDIDPDLESFSIDQEMGYQIENIVL